VTAYGSVTDLTTVGLPSTALGQLTTLQKETALETASREVDTYLRGRYLLPLTAWGSEITKATCVLAAYALMAVRGFNPQSGADVILSDRYNATIKWLTLVQKQQAHPDVTPTQASSATHIQPTLITSSVVNVATGAAGTASRPNRGW
jgi:phage gp36-like protein